MTPQSDSRVALLRRLAGAAGQQPIHADLEADPYDLNVPHRFTAGQLRKLEGLAESMAAGLTRWAGKQLRLSEPVSAAVSDQQFGARLGEQLDELGGFQLAVGVGDSACGMIVLDRPAAMSWLARLLGGEQAGTDGQLSELEAELLANMMAELVTVFSEAVEAAGGPAMQPLGPGPAEDTELPGGASMAFCRFAFQPEGSDGPAVWLAVFCELADPIVGAPRADGGAGAVPAAEAMRGHFAAIPLRATVEVGSMRLTMRQALSLEAGDVLLVRAAGEPMDLRVAGRTVLTGFPVASGGKVALRVAQTFSTSTAAPPPAQARG